MSSVVAWLIPAFLVGLVTGTRIFSGGDRVGEAQIDAAADRTISIQPVAQTSPSDEILTEPRPSDLPAPIQAVEATERPASSDSKAPSSPELAFPRSETARRPSTPPASVAQRSPAASAPRYRGSLAIDSDPPGAIVSVDGRVVGSTPVLLKDMPVGSCVVRVESSGYELWSTAARVVANKQTRVTATLQPGSAP